MGPTTPMLASVSLQICLSPDGRPTLEKAGMHQTPEIDTGGGRAQRTQDGKTDLSLCGAWSSVVCRDGIVLRPVPHGRDPILPHRAPGRLLVTISQAVESPSHLSRGVMDDPDIKQNRLEIIRSAHRGNLLEGSDIQVDRCVLHVEVQALSIREVRVGEHNEIVVAVDSLVDV